jgi:two-component system, OmpR family, sensor kinase
VRARRWHGPRACRARREQGGLYRLQCYVRARLHRRIFVWFGVSILLTGLVVAATFGLGAQARGADWRSLALVLLVAGGSLWAASGAIARRVMRPLVELERVAREIGQGKLSSRAAIDRGRDDELGVVAEAVNDMAARIEKQLAAQRELLATVSHEMRTPLAHLRVLVELAREELEDPHVADEMERELVEADALIGQLLASSQLDVAALRLTPLEANEVARRAAERAGLPVDALAPAPEGDLRFDGDPTLLARALANLLDNARKHGGGATALRVRRGARTVTFEVEDRGPGFRGVDPARAFESYSRGDGGDSGGGGGLGLGLALVRRIAAAHHGAAGAENLPAGGTRVWIELPRAVAD